MKPIHAFTNFGTIALPAEENEMSRRYLQILTRWIPVGMRTFNEWPDRPNCGHFFGGVMWYGQDTWMPIVTFALTASSPEFDTEVAGASADELRRVALKGLRYLCFTHDTGPADCVRPKESWGRTEPAGTKWGERGRGFFPESQCGRTIAGLALTAVLIQDLLGHEERQMLANIAADYMERFGEMEPRSGVYNDTQTEENAWTALGMVACMMLLPNHERLSRWSEQAKLWMFRTATMPRDSYNLTEFAKGKTVRELCGHTYTTLPDGTAENHGFVHPSYMASVLNLSGMAMNLLCLFNQPLPPHIFWHRRDCYELLKRWCDATGAPHCVQGMDWPYFAYPGHCFFHAVANLYLKDSDAGLLERRALETVERSSTAHGGRMVPEETVRHCHGPQDPSLMRERMIARLAYAYLAHRMLGQGETPLAAADFERRMHGVSVYTHGGSLIHRHVKGQTSLAWRNRTMVLPATKEGKKLIGPAEGSMLARIKVQGRAESTKPVALKIRETDDRVCALLVQDLAQESVRRQVFFASLPNGKCLTAERLIAQEDIIVEHVEQGYLSIINDGYFGEGQDLRGQRRVFWDGGQRVFSGYPTDSEENDVILDFGHTRWVNVDDRCGLVFKGSGRAIYRNRHYFEVWRAIEDDLVLSLQDEPQEFRAGEQIAELIALWCPEQTHQHTAGQELTMHETPEHTFAAKVDGFFCACNFAEETIRLPIAVSVLAGRSFPISWGVSGVAKNDLTLKLRLAIYEPTIVEL